MQSNQETKEVKTSKTNSSFILNEVIKNISNDKYKSEFSLDDNTKEITVSFSTKTSSDTKSTGLSIKQNISCLLKSTNLQQVASLDKEMLEKFNKEFKLNSHEVEDFIQSQISSLKNQIKLFSENKELTEQEEILKKQLEQQLKEINELKEHLPAVYHFAYTQPHTLAAFLNGQYDEFIATNQMDQDAKKYLMITVITADFLNRCSTSHPLRKHYFTPNKMKALKLENNSDHYMPQLALRYAYDEFLSKPMDNHDSKILIQNVPIERSNHGLPHTAREVCNVKDVVELIVKDGKTSEIKDICRTFQNPEIFGLLQTAAVFLSVGRCNEKSHEDDPTNYVKARENDSKAFVEFIEKYFSHIHQSSEMTNVVSACKEVIRELGNPIYMQDLAKKYQQTDKADEKKKKLETLIIFQILNAAHILDVPRCLTIGEDILPQRLCDKEAGLLNDATKLNDLWKLAYERLRITGDVCLTDEKSSANDARNNATFLSCSTLPNRVEETLGLFSSSLSSAPLSDQIKKIKKDVAQTIYSHADVIQHLKIKNRETKQEQKNKTESPCLSQLHLDSLLGKEEKRQTHKERVKEFIKKSAIDAKSENIYTEKFISETARALDNEQEYQNQGYYTFYHAAPREIVILYDLFTDLYRHLHMLPEDTYHRFRLSEMPYKSLPTLSEFIQYFSKISKNDDEKSMNYQADYQEMGLSVNPFLFGSHDNDTSASYYLFAKNKSVADIKPFQQDSLIDRGLESMGMDASLRKQLLTKLKAIYGQNSDAGGRLYQINIPANEVDNYVYPAVVGGKEFEINNKKIKMSEIFTLMKEKKLDASHIKSLQARLFLHPSQAKTAKTFIYESKIPEKSYHKTIQEQSKQIFSALLSEGDTESMLSEKNPTVPIYHSQIKSIFGKLNKIDLDSSFKKLLKESELHKLKYFFKTYPNYISQKIDNSVLADLKNILHDLIVHEDFDVFFEALIKIQDKNFQEYFVCMLIEHKSRFNYADKLIKLKNYTTDDILKMYLKDERIKKTLEELLDKLNITLNQVRKFPPALFTIFIENLSHGASIKHLLKEPSFSFEQFAKMEPKSIAVILNYAERACELMSGTKITFDVLAETKPEALKIILDHYYSISRLINEAGITYDQLKSLDLNRLTLFSDHTNSNYIIDWIETKSTTVEKLAELKLDLFNEFLTNYYAVGILTSGISAVSFDLLMKLDLPMLKEVLKHSREISQLINDVNISFDTLIKTQLDQLVKILEYPRNVGLLLNGLGEEKMTTFVKLTKLELETLDIFLTTTDNVNRLTSNLPITLDQLMDFKLPLLRLVVYYSSSVIQLINEASIPFDTLVKLPLEQLEKILKNADYIELLIKVQEISFDNFIKIEPKLFDEILKNQPNDIKALIAAASKDEKPSPSF